MKFELYSPETAPAGAAENLSGVEKKMGGLLPNLYRQLAESPAALEAYLTLSNLLAKTDFSPAEQQFILLVTSARNGCSYCVAAHSSGGRMAKLDKEAIESIRSGTAVADEKLQALRVYTERVIETRGKVSEADLQAFSQAGYSQKQAVELLVGVAMKTLSNYFSRMAETPLDDFLGRMAWDGNDRV